MPARDAAARVAAPGVPTERVPALGSIPRMPADLRALRSRTCHALAVGITALALAATAACGSDGDAAGSPGTASSTPGACSYPAAGQAAKDVEKPPAEPVTGTVTAEVTTNQGDLTLELDADRTPCTVSSFVSLAEQGYFDKTPCHRITTEASGIQVIQCGDPGGTGTGGPGYSFPDELDGTEQYPAGTLAMANAGPDTNGSQFFFVYGATPLPPSYTVFGQVDPASLTVLQKIAAKGAEGGAPDGPPAEPLTIEKVAVSS